VAGKRGLEGVIGKDLHSRYESRRSEEWLKVRTYQQQEFVIGGFTEPKGSREDFGALLLGVYLEGSLHFAGKVGTGFDDQTRRDLRRKFRPLIRFVEEVAKGGEVTYLKPRLVAQISFTEWTSDHKLRHPVYLGLRDDKSAKGVRREG
jgi:bifunctional non-homologous end joining protein LigD